MKTMLKIFSFFFILTLICCSCNSDYSCSNEKHKQRVYKEEICPKCDGTGTVPQTTGQKIGFAICSFGMTLMCDDEQQCPKCHGKGIIKIPVLNDSLIVE